MLPWSVALGPTRSQSSPRAGNATDRRCSGQTSPDQPRNAETEPTDPAIRTLHIPVPSMEESTLKPATTSATHRLTNPAGDDPTGAVPRYEPVDKVGASGEQFSVVVAADVTRNLRASDFVYGVGAARSLYCRVPTEGFGRAQGKGK